MKTNNEIILAYKDLTKMYELLQNEKFKNQFGIQATQVNQYKIASIVLGWILENDSTLDVVLKNTREIISEFKGDC